MAAARTPRRLDPAVVDSLATVLAAQRRLEDHVGSAVMLEPVTAQLAVTGNLVTEARGPLRAPLLRVAGQYAQFGGWLNANVQRIGQAGRWYDRALEWATEGGDHNMVATALSMKGHAAWVAGNVAPMIGLSQAAQNTPGTSPGVRALAAQQEARGHALAGDGRQADRKLDEAAALVCRAAAHPDDEPPWVYFFSPDYLVMQRGLAWLYLGRYAEAAGLLAAGLAAMPAEVRESEWVAEYLVRLATAHAQADEPEQACAAAAEAASIARQTGSARLAGKLDRLSATLTARFPGHGDVVALLESSR
jgi:tetratricopeptide (TPR) repeat protein